ncbi:hypothetical protein [Acidovorax sp. SUPP2825]|uniref:hypothetical protein n=1 Tax=Acidovorax sp. SUPP2825 TaxID=2920879 RepID=UPI0023DE5BC5|nr:hypothetical protein [Acidovorax sp. SUPP2825]GKS94747.1 hypothetical protein AVAK2825_09450 [Acidovorax sp. SUPP2825]
MPRSPDGTHRAVLRFEGEIRFGPEYFRLSIDGRGIPHRIFGQPLLWSPDSRFLATQEWLTTDYAAGPITCAALIDVDRWKIARLEVLAKGFAQDFRWEGATLHYQQVFAARSTAFSAQATLESVAGWAPIDAAPPRPAEGA